MVENEKRGRGMGVKNHCCVFLCVELFELIQPIIFGYS